MTWSDEDIKLVEKFIMIKNNGYYASGQEVTNVYNRILGKNVSPTNCASCIRGRISELETALNKFKKKIEIENKAISEGVESVGDTEVNNSKVEGNKANVEAKKSKKK